MLDNKNKKKKILLTKAAMAPYDVHLFNRLSKYFDISLLFFEKVESHRKWEWAQKNIKFNYFIANTKQIKLFGKTLNISKIPKNIDLNTYDEIIVETDTKNLLNNILILKKAEKLNKKLGCSITIYKGYQVFIDSTILSKTFNLLINSVIKKYFIKNKKIVKYTAYGVEHCSLVANSKPCFEPNAYYPLKEEYGNITLSDIKAFNTLRYSNKNKIKLLVISYLSPRKNIDLLIKIINKLDNFELHIIGDGDNAYVNYLKTISSDNIIFHGLKFGEEKKSFLINADFLIFHSLKDVWGFVTHEAMYFGLPVIASKNVQSARQIISDCKCGFIYKDEKELLMVLDYIKNLDKEEYNQISLTSKTYIDQFTEDCYENWKKFLEA